MTDRVVAVVVPATAGPLGADLTAAMFEDVVDLVFGTPEIQAALAVPTGAGELAAGAAWPGTATVELGSAATLAEVLEAVRPLATAAVAVVVADVPDLPTLLLGKLFSALAGPPRLELAPVELALCAADGGGLVAAAVQAGALPDWLAALDVHLDDPDALTRLQAAAPKGSIAICPGWHRIRSTVDLAGLDPGLEGWDATRSLL